LSLKESRLILSIGFFSIYASYNVEQQMKLIARLIFFITGWKVKERLPDGIKKCVVIAAPHTSNWDFVYAMAAFYIMDMRIRYVAKKELFVFPLGIIMRAFGGIPVDRSKRNNLVDNMVKLFKEQEKLYLLIPPEGTRSKVDKWKTGFYYTAFNAQVPLVCGYLDYAKKEAGLGMIYTPSGNYDNDLREIKSFYSGVTPKYSQSFA
jgi:1-acyl-sn-glycerol-3-phosphate acyltransferase